MRPCSSFTIRFSDRLLVFLWSIPDWADMGLGLIYGTVLAAWAMLIMRTALVLFGWSADAITTLLTGLDPLWWTPESLEAKPPRRESTCRRVPGRATQRSSRPRRFSWPAPLQRGPSASSPTS